MLTGLSTISLIDLHICVEWACYEDNGQLDDADSGVKAVHCSCVASYGELNLDAVASHAVHCIPTLRYFRLDTTSRRAYWEVETAQARENPGKLIQLPWEDERHMVHVRRSSTTCF
jgi:hypothetical protein